MKPQPFGMTASETRLNAGCVRIVVNNPEVSHLWEVRVVEVACNTLSGLFVGNLHRFSRAAIIADRSLRSTGVVVFVKMSSAILLGSAMSNSWYSFSVKWFVSAFVHVLSHCMD